MSDNTTNNKLHTAAETAKILKCGLSNVYAIAGKELRCYRVGAGKAGLRFSDEQIQDFLDSREMGGEATPEKEPPRPERPVLKHLDLR